MATVQTVQIEWNEGYCTYVSGLLGAELVVESDSRGEEGPAVPLLRTTWVKKPVADGAFQGSYSLM